MYEAFILDNYSSIQDFVSFQVEPSKNINYSEYRGRQCSDCSPS